MEDAEYQRMSAAEDGHWWYRGLHDLVLWLARGEKDRLNRPLAMLDAGCGTGRLGQLLAPLGEVTGCDVHPLALEAATRRGLTRVLRRDLARDDLGREEFDLITTMDVLYHSLVSDERQALQRLYRALRPGGLLLVQVPAFECLRGSHDLAVHTRRRYRRDEVVRLLASAGFTVEWATCRLAPFFPLFLLWRLGSRRRAKAGSDVAHLPAPFINRLLFRILKIENSLITFGIHFPLGTSVFAAARK